MRRRDPFKLNETLSELAAGWQPLTPIAEIQRIWPAAVGDLIASWATPISERQGTVTVGCKDAVTAQELELQRTALLTRIQDASQATQVRELKFVVKG